MQKASKRSKQRARVLFNLYLDEIASIFHQLRALFVFRRCGVDAARFVRADMRRSESDLFLHEFDCILHFLLHAFTPDVKLRRQRGWIGIMWGR